MDENNNQTKKSASALREEAVLKFWRENKIFEKSLEKEAPKGKYVFYDGPPFATGLPHYGHILGSVAKDAIGRYQTMAGFRVPRRWGWDCHGLPIENIVENDLKISGKKEIEELGIGKFTEYARSKVLTYVGEWRKTVDRIGRWVDFENSYKTMDNTFIESVWWALGELNKKELLYEGVRVLAYCPRCETPIANSEIAMDNSYKDITDISVYVKFPLVGEKNTYLLAWTTTPWTLPGNTAIAINRDFTYLYVSHTSDKGKEILILAKERFDSLKDKFTNPEILKEVKGSELVGKSYEPVFDYYKETSMPNKENAWKVWHADFVTLDVGTGIAHEAPAFGEDDMNLAKKNNIPFIRHVEPNGTFSKEVTDFAGIKVKPKEDPSNSSGQVPQSTDVLVIKYLAQRGSLLAKEKIVHSYPHCYRCETPLLYYALPSWFVNIQKVKNNLLRDAKSMNWIPAHLKDGRFKNTMESAPDWTISRNRYWASPLPFWKSKSGKVMFVNSIEDLKAKTKKSGNRYFVMRHGEAESNVLRILNSDITKENHLTEKGKNQIRESSKLLKEVKFDYIIVSPFLRTKETANLVKKELNSSAEIIFDDRLKEEDMGIFEGKTSDDYRRAKGSINKYIFQPEGGESFKDVKLRVSEFIYDIEKRYENKKILIVTHGAPAIMLQAGIKGFNDDKTIEELENLTDLKVAEAKEFSFVPLPHNDHYELDLHRPYIDAITLADDAGEEYQRIPEVIDCWFESGSMPFAQDHFPFEHPDWRRKNFPAGFVAEYVAQTRTWFYYTHVISSILFQKAPFKNVVTTGTILAEDGQKMSKSKNNFPDPWILFNKYSVDALRFYLLASPLMKGEDINFSEKGVQDVSNKIINRLDNVVAFYELYRDEKIEAHSTGSGQISSTSVLDIWILARLEELVSETTKGMERYDMALVAKPIESFIDDLSTWYLRRSRERLKDEAASTPTSAQGYGEARHTLYFVLKTLAKIMAPFAPFTAEDIWQKLKNKQDVESVHLASWPKQKMKLFGLFNKKNSKTIKEMQQVREIVTLGLQARQKAGIPVRQPLNELRVKNLKLANEYLELIKDELNVKEVIPESSTSKLEPNADVWLDLEITPELKVEGAYRELSRAIQERRKKMGLTPSDVVRISIETNEAGKELIQKFEAEIKKTVLASEVKLESNEGAKFSETESPDASKEAFREEIRIHEMLFKVKIIK
jgi:isoleucyl-tRNA synthetase